MRVAIGTSLLLATTVTIALPVSAILFRMGTPPSHLTAATMVIGMIVAALAYLGARIGGIRVPIAAFGLAAVLIVLTHCGVVTTPRPKPPTSAASPTKAMR